MMNLFNRRLTQIYCFTITLFVLGFSIYSQYVLLLVPCPLCMMQRLCVFLILVGLGFSFCLRGRQRFFAIWQILFSTAGLYFALRQLWLQTFPLLDAPSCMPGLETLIHYFPWTTVAHALFWGSGECAEKGWLLFGLSMPAWSGLYFLLMLLLGGWLYFQKSR
jgi:disulfide bond formation protein DsbB